jgi:hypothetical protein
MTADMELVVGADGGVKCIYDEGLDLRVLGKLQITRAVSAHHRHLLLAVAGAASVREKSRRRRPTDGCRGAWPASPT